MKTLPIIAAAFTLASVNAALAAEQTVTLAVANMTCESCPYIVKQSLTKVPGVKDVRVSFEQKTATVTYDDQKTTLAELTAATTNAGYPSHITHRAMTTVPR